MSEPTAMQLLAAELVREAGPLLVEFVREHLSGSTNELLTVTQIAKELHTRPSTVRTLIRAGTLRRAKDIAEMRVSRRELERYTAGK